MRPTTETEIRAVLALDGPTRAGHLIKRVADSAVAWSLWEESGWALMANDDGTQVFPLWPSREYAELLRTGDWLRLEARAVPLEELLHELLPKLALRGILIGIFPTPTGKGVTMTRAELSALLGEELERY